MEANLSEWKKSWNETLRYFEGIDECKEIRLDFKLNRNQATKEETKMKWKRCRNKLFILKLKVHLYQLESEVRNVKSEAEFLRWKRDWNRHILEYGCNFCRN
jgi:hypothetical protein